MEKYINDSLRVTWNNEWIHDYESPWSIFEKFKYVNTANIQDIFCLFGTQEARKLKYRFGKYHRDLFSLKGLENKQLTCLFGIELKELVKYNIKVITEILPDDRNSNIAYFYNNLVFCEECLAMGYHSWLHQFNLLSVCPIHHIRLKSCCPSCNFKIPFLLSDENPPFKCKCGHSFLKEFSISEMSTNWKKAKELMIKDEITSKWILINNTYHSDIKIEFLYDFYLYKETDVLNKILNVLFPKVSMKANNETLNKINIFHPKKSDNFYFEDFQLQEEIYKTSRYTLKSLVRYFKKTFLHKHKSCICRYKKMRLNEEKVCPFAFAFVHWKKNMEGLENYWEVDNGFRVRRTKSLSPIFFEFASKQDTSLLFELWYRLEKNRIKFNMGHPEMISIINRVMCILAINHFNNWINFATQQNFENTKTNTIPSDHNILPFFFILLNKTENISFWIYSTPNKKRIEDIPCPFIK